MISTKKRPVRRSKSPIGKRFRCGHADANLLWQVTKRRGKGVYDCVVVGEPDADYAGMTRVFDIEEIRHRIRLDALWKKSEDAHEAFYDSLRLGQVVHYHYGFGQFVRCEVAIADDSVVGTKPGKKCLRAIALVGPWPSYDLQQDRYHVRDIAEGRLFQAHASNLWENSTFARRLEHGDPTKMKPLDLPSSMKVVLHWPSGDEPAQAFARSETKIRVMIEGEDLPFTFYRKDGGWVEESTGVSVIQISGQIAGREVKL